VAGAGRMILVATAHHQPPKP